MSSSHVVVFIVVAVVFVVVVFVVFVERRKMKERERVVGWYSGQ